MQTYKNIEIILVDDGSTDCSGSICDRYALIDDRIKVIHKPNGGLVSARKAGIIIAKGQYTGFVDGDDFIEEKNYEILCHSLEEEQVDFIHSGYLKNSSQRFSTKYRKKYIVKSKNTIVTVLRNLVFNPTDDQFISPSIWSKLFRSELIREVYSEIPETQPYGEDLLCLCGCITKCGSFGTIPDAYYHYIKREGSICNERKIENISRENRLYEELKRLFKINGVYPALRDDLERFYLRNLLICIKQLTNVICPVYQYPAPDDLTGKKVIIYGAGEVGRDYFVHLCQCMHCSIIGVADKNAGGHLSDSVNLIRTDAIADYEYDVIVIAVLREETAEEIQKELMADGIGKDRILWRKPIVAI